MFFQTLTLPNALYKRFILLMSVFSIRNQNKDNRLRNAVFLGVSTIMPLSGLQPCFFRKTVKIWILLFVLHKTFRWSWTKKMPQKRQFKQFWSNKMTSLKCRQLIICSLEYLYTYTKTSAHSKWRQEEWFIVLRKSETDQTVPVN